MVTDNYIGYRRLPNHSWPGPFGTEIVTNGAGFRDRESSEGKSAGVTRIVLIGDSVTEGYGVSVEHRYSTLLENRLNSRGEEKRYEVLNFALSGYNTLDEYVILRDVAMKYHPDRLVLQLGYNDIASNSRSRGVFEDGSWVGMGKRLRRTVQHGCFPFGEEKCGVRRFLQKHSAFYLALAEQYNSYKLRRGGSNAILSEALAIKTEDLFYTGEILGRISGLCSTGGIICSATYLPLEVEVEVADERKAKTVESAFRRALEPYPSFSYIEVLTPLRKGGGAALFLDDVHLTQRGHEIVAAALMRAF